jgi:hypothetical protein
MFFVINKRVIWIDCTNDCKLVENDIDILHENIEQLVRISFIIVYPTRVGASGTGSALFIVSRLIKDNFKTSNLLYLDRRTL